MSNRERKVRGKRLMALLFALMLALGSVTPSSAVSKGNAKERVLKTASTFYDLVENSYNALDPASGGDSGGGGGGSTNPDPAPVYVPDPVYVLVSVVPVTDTISVGKGVTETEMKELFPKSTTLNITVDGSPSTLSGSISWTETSRETIDTHTTKITYTGSISVPYYVTNPNSLSTSLTLTAYMTDKIDISKAKVTLKSVIDDDKDENIETTSSDSYEYDGKQVRPGVEVEVESKTLPASAYTVTYGENNSIGKGTVTITANETSDYVGSVTKEFTIEKGTLRVTYREKNYLYCFPRSDWPDDFVYLPYYNEDPKKLSYKITYDGSKVTEPEKKATDPTAAIAMISMSKGGYIVIKPTIPYGDYNITFSSPNFKNSVNLCIKAYADIPHITYDLYGGRIYRINESGKEEVVEETDGFFTDYFDEETVTDGVYNICVGGDYKKYKYVVKKGNQDPNKGKVLKFKGWYTDSNYKNKLESDTITDTNKSWKLYAKFKCDSDLKVPKTEYNKHHLSEAFNLNATCTTAITYKSTNTKVCTVSKKGKVSIRGIGTATIEVTAASNTDFTGKTIKVKINVAVKGPNKITSIKKRDKNSNSVKVDWKKVKNLAGYQIQVSTDKNFKAAETNDFTVSGGDKQSVTISRFSPKKNFVTGKAYYFRLRGYQTKMEGKKEIKKYSSWTPKIKFILPK